MTIGHRRIGPRDRIELSRSVPRREGGKLRSGDKAAGAGTSGSLARPRSGTRAAAAALGEARLGVGPGWPRGWGAERGWARLAPLACDGTGGDGTVGHGRAGPAAPALWLGRPAQRCPPEALSAPQISVVAGGGRRARRGAAGPARAGPASPGVCPGTTGGPGVPRAGLGRCPGPSWGRRDRRPSAVAGGARPCPALEHQADRRAASSVV